MNFNDLLKQDEKEEDGSKEKIDKKSEPKRVIKKATKKLKSSTTDKRVNQNMDRKLRIAACERCNGKPETYEDVVSGYYIRACALCDEVIEYNKI